MNQPEPFIDIHCHLLPELDDGAADWNEALAMAEMAAADGVVSIVATPHQLGSYQNNSAEKIRTQTVRFQELLARRGIRLQLLPGADVRIDADLAKKITSGSVLTLADRRRHVLLELPHEVYIPLNNLLSELHRSGITGILSHPERNQGIINQPKILSDLAEQGCLFQVTAGSLMGVFGGKIQKFAESMIQNEYVDFIASDAHGTKNRTTQLSPAFNRVVEMAGYDAAVDIFCRNPACIISGKSVTSRNPFRYRKQITFHQNSFLRTACQFVHLS